MSRRASIALQAAISTAALFVAVVASIRFLDWLFAGSAFLWGLLLGLPAMIAFVIYVVDLMTEGGADGQ